MNEGCETLQALFDACGGIEKVSIRLKIRRGIFDDAVRRSRLDAHILMRVERLWGLLHPVEVVHVDEPPTDRMVECRGTGRQVTLGTCLYWYMQVMARDELGFGSPCYRCQAGRRARESYALEARPFDGDEVREGLGTWDEYPVLRL